MTIQTRLPEIAEEMIRDQPEDSPPSAGRLAPLS
jgi:hypothetical protein